MTSIRDYTNKGFESNHALIDMMKIEDFWNFDSAKILEQIENPFNNDLVFKEEAKINEMNFKALSKKNIRYQKLMNYDKNFSTSSDNLKMKTSGSMVNKNSKWPISEHDMDFLKSLGRKLLQTITKTSFKANDKYTTPNSILIALISFIGSIEDVINEVGVHCYMKEMKKNVKMAYEIIEDINRNYVLIFTRLAELFYVLKNINVYLGLGIFNDQDLLNAESCLSEYFELNFCDANSEPHLVVEYLIIQNVPRKGKTTNYNFLSRKISHELTSKHWQAYVLPITHRRYQKTINSASGAFVSKYCQVVELIFTPPIKIDNEPNKTMYKLIYQLLQEWGCANNCTIRAASKLIKLHKGIIRERQALPRMGYCRNYRSFTPYDPNALNSKRTKSRFQKKIMGKL